MYLIVKCRKCGHILYIEGEPPIVELASKLDSVLDMGCPNCGEPPYENWLLYAFEKNN